MQQKPPKEQTPAYKAWREDIISCIFHGDPSKAAERLGLTGCTPLGNIAKRLRRYGDMQLALEVQQVAQILSEHYGAWAAYKQAMRIQKGRT
jgi:hypothetical protein